MQKVPEDIIDYDDPDVVADFGDGPHVFRRSFLYELLKDMHDKQSASTSPHVTVDTGQHLSARTPPLHNVSGVPRESVSEMDVVTLSDTSNDGNNDLDAFDLMNIKPAHSSTPGFAENIDKALADEGGNLFLQRPVARLYEATFGKESGSSVPFKKRSQVRKPALTPSVFGQHVTSSSTTPVFGQHVTSTSSHYQSGQGKGEDGVYIPSASEAALPGVPEMSKTPESFEPSDSGKTKSRKVSKKGGSAGKQKGNTTGKAAEPPKQCQESRGVSPSRKKKKNKKTRKTKCKQSSGCESLSRAAKRAHVSPSPKGKRVKKSAKTSDVSKIKVSVNTRDSGISVSVPGAVSEEANVNGLGEKSAGKKYSEEGDVLSLLSDSDTDLSDSLIDEEQKTVPGGEKRSLSPSPTCSKAGVSGDRKPKSKGKSTSKPLKQEVKVLLEAVDMGEPPDLDIELGPFTPNVARTCRKQKQKAQAALARAARAAKRARLSSSCSDIFAPSDGESPEGDKCDKEYHPPTRDRYPSIMGFGDGPVLLGTRTQPVAGRTRKRSK